MGQTPTVRGQPPPLGTIEEYIEPTTTMDKALQSEILERIFSMEASKRANPTACFTKKIL